jgi:hypothetical protein
MKIATSILALAATAGLALLALTTRKDSGVIEPVESVDMQASNEAPTRVPATADTWFV